MTQSQHESEMEQTLTEREYPFTPIKHIPGEIALLTGVLPSALSSFVLSFSAVVSDFSVGQAVGYSCVAPLLAGFGASFYYEWQHYRAVREDKKNERAPRLRNNRLIDGYNRRYANILMRSTAAGVGVGTGLGVMFIA